MSAAHHTLRATPTASPEEAAAIVAALERFMRATAPPASEPAETLDGWHRAAILEGVSRDPGDGLPEPWLQPPG
ncbi:MAG TPA: hypothetical protein VK790_13090 [Solirubrobacteraceae bacterium]|jgi:hypothetical protein|nr:hypothetical protein [Solirubrobacteraceae bacterium]